MEGGREAASGFVVVRGCVPQKFPARSLSMARSWRKCHLLMQIVGVTENVLVPMPALIVL